MELYLFHFDFFIKCFLALVLGGLIGLEREYRRKPAGIKTHVLICLGATVLTFLSLHISPEGDPSRIAAQIVSGIGFICAGTILHSRRIILGLTTAGTLWLVTSVGMLIGSGYYVASILVYILVTVFLFFSTRLTKSESSKRSYSLSIEVVDTATLAVIEDMIAQFGLYIQSKSLIKKHGVRLEINYATTSLTHHLFLKRLLRLKGLGEIVTV